MTGSDGETEFDGSKLALFIGEALLVYLRDDFAHIPFPAHWDFPGGGREAGETPEACALRETYEEFGLRVPRERLCYRRAHRGNPDSGLNWFFAAHLPIGAEAAIRFGDEGQHWALMAPAQYAAHPARIPHLAALLQDYLALPGRGPRGCPAPWDGPQLPPKSPPCHRVCSFCEQQKDCNDSPRSVFSKA